MRRRPLVIVALVVAASAPPSVDLSPVVAAAPPAPRVADVSVTLDGHGNGHGIGLSQWGAYGYAVDHGWTAAQILDHYYGGTVAGTVPLSTEIRVRLQNLDNAQTSVAVDSGTLQITGEAAGSWRSVLVRETATQGRYAVWARTDVVRCPAASGDPAASGWTLVDGAKTSTVEVRTAADSSTVTSRTQLLSTCEPSGTVRWYRGAIVALNDANGANRTINVVPVEQYLRTVIAMEMSPGWADDGGGKGAQALQSQAVAARSYALAYDWYSYADVCDMVCQSYYGVAYQVAGGTVRTVEHPATDAAVAATAGKVRRLGSTSGAIALTMFSASNGGYSAPGTSVLGPFPAVPDAGDATSLNPNHDWSVVLSGAAIAARYPAIGTFTGLTVLTRNGYGEWGGRVLTLRVSGTSGSVDVSGSSFRSAMGLKDTWFNVRSASSPPPPAGDGCDGRVAPAVSGPLPAPVGALFTTRAPKRLVDTRTGTGTAKLPLGAGCTLAVPTGTAATASAVAVQITVYGPQANGFVAAYACGTERPATAVMLAAAGRTTAASATVRIGADRRICVYSSMRTAVSVDLVGVFGTAGAFKFQPVLPARLADTRSATRPAAGSTRRVKVAGTTRVPVGAKAAAVTVHASGAATNGSVTVWNCSATRPSLPSMWATKGVDVTNQVMTPLSSAGELCVYVSAAMHVTVDVSGWFGASATTRYFASSPARVVDTRSGVGLPGGFAAGANRAVTLAGRGGLPSAATLRSVEAHVGVTGSPSAGYVTVHPCLSPVPSVSMVRWGANAPAATAVAGVDDSSGRWCIMSSTTAHVVVDVVGWFA